MAALVLGGGVSQKRKGRRQRNAQDAIDREESGGSRAREKKGGKKRGREDPSKNLAFGKRVEEKKPRGGGRKKTLGKSEITKTRRKI